MGVTSAAFNLPGKIAFSKDMLMILQRTGRCTGRVIFNLLSARHVVLPCATPHRANTGSFRATIFHVNYLCPQVMGPHLATNWLGLVRSRSCQGHLKVKTAKILKKKTCFTVFCCKWVFHKAAVDIFWLESLPPPILGHGDYMWLGGVIPHSYITRTLLYHTLYQH